MSDFNRGALQIPCLRLDYGFGEQWASVELGDGTGYVRLADYEKLESENAELREERDEWHRVAVSKQDIIDHMRDARVENAKLRALCKDLYGQVKADDSTWEIIRRREDELPCYADHFIAGYDCSLGKVRIADGFADRIRELGVEVGG